MASNKTPFQLNKRFVRRNALIINRPKRRFFVIPKKIIKTKVLTANYSRQNDCKIIITDIITHIPCCYIEKIRIIKSAIQKTYILVFILKHSEKQTKNPANTNIKRQ